MAWSFLENKISAGCKLCNSLSKYSKLPSAVKNSPVVISKKANAPNSFSK